MGTLDINKSYQPINNTPQGAFSNPLSYYEFRTARTYENPVSFSMSPVPGPFTPAGISETQLREFLQDKWHWPSANAQIVSTPERPVDQGTYNAILGNAGQSGVYLQSNVIGTTKQYSGTTPTTGIYTGYYAQSGTYFGASAGDCEGGC